MTLLEDLAARGMIEQITNEEGLSELLAKPGGVIYVGFDPTADSLHVGHLLPALTLARFQRAGHQPIALVGGATGMIGDPSGKCDERSLITIAEVEANSEGIRKQLAHFMSFDGHNPAIMANNVDWTANVSYLDWLRDVGKHFSVNYMLGKESVRRRIEDREQGISYTEFSYMLLQANDFLQLYDLHNCRIQGGGNDQWGNITAGTDLVRRRRSAEVFGITFPLLTTAAGEKFGKTAGNAVWLDPDKTSPYQFYQFWIRSDDRDAARYLRLFTFLSLDEINALIAEHEQSPERRIAQRKLAEEMTRTVHGDDGLNTAVRASEVLFGNEIEGLSDRDLGDIFADVPSFEITRAELSEGLRLADALVRAGAAKSKGEATRAIKGGGVYVNNRKASGIGQTLEEADLASETMLVLRSGKKNYFLGRVG
jgi:tyrosyl-tRNA synthetase